MRNTPLIHLHSGLSLTQRRSAIIGIPPPLQEHVREIVEKLYEENGLTSASKQDPSHPLKIKAIGSWACKLEVEACIKDAQKVNRSEPR